MPAGFFGKLPAQGDFVARGLLPGMRGVLDRWLTAHLAPLVYRATAWPEGGVRAVIDAETPHLLVIEPSEDSAGRLFPLVACAPQNGAGRAEADAWADAAWPLLLRGTEDGADPADLAGAMARLDDPAPGDAPLIAPVLWWRGADPADAAPRLAELARISSG